MNKTKMDLITEKEVIVKRFEEEEFWTWCEKCLSRIMSQKDTHKFVIETGPYYEFDICNPCYLKDFQFLEQGVVCEFCKQDITNRNPMIQEGIRLFCNKKCFMAIREK